jgi:integrase
MLSETKIRAAKPADRAYKLFDGAGLYLLVVPAVRQAGARKWWRLDYRFGGKRKTISLGTYPEVSLLSARRRRDEARRMLAEGRDPAELRKAQKAEGTEGTFRAVALEWHSRQSSRWDPGHAARIMRRLALHVFPVIGQRPIKEITAPEILTLLRSIEARGTIEAAHRVHQIISQVFRYAVATGNAERDPAADLKGALQPVKSVSRAAITEPKAVGELLRAIDGYQGAMAVQCALRLAPLVFVRPGELRRAEWSEFDLDEGTWRIPAAKMKMRADHVVPLSRQAIAILRELQPLTGSGRYLFPSERTRDRPMSENTLNAALRRLGYRRDEMTAHGFRAMASTLLNEQGWPVDVIERQLAHAERNKVRAAYNRAEYLPERRKMMQAWADYLDALRSGAPVIALRRGST